MNRGQGLKNPQIWMYHSVAEHVGPGDDPFEITVTSARLADHLRWLGARGLRGVSVRELLAAPDPSRLVGLTFDDGYEDFALLAVPLLRKHGCTATVYLVAGRIGQYNAWESHGPVKPLMDMALIEQCAEAGMELGSHGLRHVRLSGQDPDRLTAEVAESRIALQRLTGQPIDGYCYAYGDLDERAVAAVRAAGYDYACAIRPGPHVGRHALPRFYVGDRDNGPRLTAKRVRAGMRGRGVPTARYAAGQADGRG